MEQTADFLRGRLQELRCVAAFGDSAEAVWLEAGSRVEWAGWWEPGLDSREDWAAVVAAMLLQGQART